ncbi:MAG TPA: translation initiation factor IF-2, partial [Bacillus bacterium]|nr:translation initiation factor IF-2 [Bacillus sp. (in: firmicutes)]
MSKTRVYEYAKKHNLSSKDVIIKLKEMNIEVSNHMTAIEDEAVRRLDAIYNKKEEQTKTQEKPQQQSQPKAAQGQNQGQKQGQNQNRSQGQSQNRNQAQNQQKNNQAQPKAQLKTTA